MNPNFDVSCIVVVRFLAMVFIAALLGSCATPDTQDSIPEEFISTNASTVIQTRDEFVSQVVGKSLRLLHDNIDAALEFNDDGTATGTLIRDGNEVAMNLDWVWEDSTYCRTGSIGDNKTTRKCESVTLFPDVGVLLTYVDADDPDEYWVFE